MPFRWRRFPAWWPAAVTRSEATAGWGGGRTWRATRGAGALILGGFNHRMSHLELPQDLQRPAGNLQSKVRSEAEIGIAILARNLEPSELWQGAPRGVSSTSRASASSKSISSTRMDALSVRGLYSSGAPAPVSRRTTRGVAHAVHRARNRRVTARRGVTGPPSRARRSPAYGNITAETMMRAPGHGERPPAPGVETCPPARFNALHMRAHRGRLRAPSRQTHEEPR
jgi:hypothetical protein